MTPFGVLNEILGLNKKIDMLIFNEKPIPKELILEHNKLMNDYNESLKVKGNEPDTKR